MPSLGPLDLPLPWCYEQLRLQKSLQRLSCASSRVGHTSRSPHHNLSKAQSPSHVISTSQIRGSPRSPSDFDTMKCCPSIKSHISPSFFPSFQVTNSAHDVNRIHRLSDPVPHWVAYQCRFRYVSSIFNQWPTRISSRPRTDSDGKETTALPLI